MIPNSVRKVLPKFHCFFRTNSPIQRSTSEEVRSLQGEEVYGGAEAKQEDEDADGEEEIERGAGEEENDA